MSRGPRLPLGVLAASVVLLCSLAVGTATALTFVISGVAPWSSLARGLMAGAAVSVIAAALAAVLARRLVSRLRSLRSIAVQRSAEPDSGVRSTGSMFCAEIDDLARTFEALALRARVADEVGERHRRTAETASAGMFELLSGLVAAEEGARGQLAAELHDTVAQSLALTRSSLSDGDPESVRRAADYADDAEEQVRAVMARTRPPALREGDLAGAVADLRDELQQRYGLSVDLAWPDVAHPLPLATAVTIYRFFQEALLNVVKHADVEWAEAQLVVDETGIVATVLDAGPGFDLALVRPQKGRHVGLGLLRERARLAGGTLEVSSMPAAGTVLQLRLPHVPTGGRPAVGVPSSGTDAVTKEARAEEALTGG
ncbi:MAG TPA: ATP-binding protein [Mycobacteriales bacterium]|nr:ATP-binding protein [Mycobacteriales bacterium]